jgi:hypothetical protein
MFAAVFMKQAIFFCFIVLSLLLALFNGTGCANIIPPQGGPRDTLPPQLLRAEPPDSTTNFTGNIIRLHFDEYIDIKDERNNLLFTPLFNNNPIVEARLRTLTIKLRDTLEPNTTYTFKFGNAIVDYNEGNRLEGFTYRFSTGPSLDSLEVRGKVILAETGKIDSTLTIVLYRNLTDSAVMNERPRYATNVDRNGNFIFQNLPQATFAIYAIGDAGLGRRYLSKAQTFAFLDSPVVVQPGIDTLTLYAYKEMDRATTSGTTTSTPASGLPVRGLTANDRRLRYTTNLSNNQHDLLKNFQLNFEQPLTQFDSTLIQLSSDTTYIPENFSVALDSLRRTLTINTTWKEGTLYHLILDKEFAEDSSGRRLLKSDTLNFSTRKLSDYGNVQIRIRNVDAALNPLLQFVQNNQVVFTAPLQNGSFSNSMFMPGEYELRILYDRNGNGKWDPGEFFSQKRQPELVRPIERRITIRPNWNNEFEIAL